MIKLEDILDDAGRYLRGEMDDEERSFFEELLVRHPHLREELRLMELARQRLVVQVAAPYTGIRRRRYVWPLILVLFLLGALALWLLFFQDKSAGRAAPEPPQPAPAGQNEDRTYFQIEQGGGDSDDANADRGFGVQWTSTGDLAFTGIFEGTGRLGGREIAGFGEWDMLLGAYNLETGFSWLIPIGSPDFKDMPRDLAVDSEDNLVITGSAGNLTGFGDFTLTANGEDNWGNRDLFVAKFNPEGQLLWLDHCGGWWLPHIQTGHNQGQAVTVDVADNVIFTAQYVNSTELSGVPLPAGGPVEDLLLAKYSPDGQNQWVRTVTADDMIIGQDLATDAEQNIYLAGGFGHHNFSGRAFFPGDTLTSFGGRDIFLAKYSPEGEMLWVRQAGSPKSDQGHESANSIAVEPMGNVVIAGLFQDRAFFGPNTPLVSYGGHDIFLAKYDTNGRLLWARQAGSPFGSSLRNEHAQAVAISRTGEIFLTGAFTGDAAFGDKTLRAGEKSNFFLAKYSPDGECLWARQFEGLEGFEKASGIGININATTNSIAVTGLFSGKVKIGERVLESRGGGDIFLLLFNEDGELLSAKSVMGYES
jgi:hypothetical protein